MILQVFLWALTIASITATILNIKKFWVAFPMWIVTNSSWAIYNFSKGLGDVRMAGYAMNSIHYAVKYSAEHTVNILMEELEENGTDSCVNLLIEMDNLLKTGLYDRYIERTNLAMEVNT